MPVVKNRREINKNPKIHGPQAQWSQKQKFNCVVTFLMVGNVPATSAATGVPIWTLKKWKRTSWWKEMELDVRSSRNVEVSTKLHKITEKVLKQLDDRLENGDVYYDPKKQEVRRVPINARNLNTIAKDSIDRTILMERLVQEAPQQKEQEDIRVRLDNLMDEFKKFAKKESKSIGSTFEGEIIDVQTPSHESEGLLEVSSGETPQQIPSVTTAPDET